MCKSLDIIKELFNIEKLKLADADWCGKHDYEIICGNGKVENVVFLPLQYINEFDEAL